MQIYLVGGAVRSKLLGLPVEEKDWVVVGGTPEILVKKGFKPVGKSFPVFLHPKTKEEYALARIEKKQGVGYHGFTFYTAPDVSLEDDLKRRDLTINAMAMDEQGKIIDPYGGQLDLEKRLLRHVSPAFVEDPLRVLRVARFAATLAPFGFSLASETAQLMRNISQSGELKHLAHERLWQEFQKALSSTKPSGFFQVLHHVSALSRLFPPLQTMMGIPLSPHIFSTVNAFSHLMHLIDQPLAPSIRFALIAYQLSYANTTPKHWPLEKGEPDIGIPLLEALQATLTPPNEYRQLAQHAIHSLDAFLRFYEQPLEKQWKLFKRLDAYRRPEKCAQLSEVAFAAIAYRKESYCPLTIAQWQDLHSQWQSIDIQKLQQQGLSGQPLGDAIQKKRLEILSTIQRSSQPRESGGPPETKEKK